MAYWWIPLVKMAIDKQAKNSNNQTLNTALGITSALEKFDRKSG